LPNKVIEVINLMQTKPKTIAVKSWQNNTFSV
jgi:hypothetical protein